jgi:hypothetical protein
MTRQCTRTGCYVHEGVSCPEGEPNHADCPHWSASDAAPDLPTDAFVAEGARVPWTSSALGMDDVALVGARGRAIVIGILGSHDAGKTTLLTAAYLHLVAGNELAGARFAGSRSLGAWEALASWARFDDAARRPTFPPHTPRGAARAPGLLHLALRGPRDEHRDVLLTDAPGEWFSQWALYEEAPAAEGARWIARNADAFLVFADSEKMRGSTRGAEREALRQLIERLGNHVGARPTTLVWSKHEQAPPERLRASIEATLATHVPNAAHCETTHTAPESLVRALESALRPAWTPPTARRVTLPVLAHSPFAAYRGAL